MKAQSKALTLSLLAHAAFVGCTFALSQQAVALKPPIIINFTMEAASNEDTAVAKAPAEPLDEIVKKPEVREKQIILPKKKEVVRKLKKTPVQESVPAPIPSPAPVQEPSEAASAVDDSTAQEGGEANATPAQAASGHGGQSMGNDGSSESGQYLQKNYEYIRKHIMDNLIYTAAAQRMGMRGKVMVSFIINMGGDVEALTILSSCGHELLDANVIKTIHKAAPFPKPPARAKIILPIVYELKSALGNSG